MQIGWMIGDNFYGLNGFQSWFAISRANPQLPRTIAAGLKEEHRVVRAALREQLVRHFFACQLRHFSNDPVVESVLWSPLSHVSEHLDLS